MSTIASPRPSFTLSSRRGSASTDNTILSNPANKSTTALDRATLRRNRAALRDYYNLQASGSSSTLTEAQDPSPPLPTEQIHELDKPDFSPEVYVSHLLSTSNFESALRIEASLLSDIRSLDGEKKALVYDNYSKLIAATDTIRAMREKMEERTPGTSTLSPAIGHIAEVAVGLKKELSGGAGGEQGRVEMGRRRREQREVVRWVLESSERIRGMVESGEEEDARDEWERVEGILGQWEGVKGVEGVRKACLEALGGSPEG